MNARAEVKASQKINADPEKAKEMVNKGIEQLTGEALSKPTIDGAWKSLSRLPTTRSCPA